MTDIRSAVPADAARIAAIEASATEHPWSLDDVTGTLDTASTRAWVTGEPVVGHVLFTVAGPCADVLTIAVHPDHRRRGHARALLQHAHDALHSTGVEEVFLEVRADNDGAIALYTAMAYERVGLRRRYYRDGVDAVLMRRDIGGSAGAEP